MRLTIIVVSYNTRDLLRRCLSSLGTGHEVIVVDNASSDGSCEMVRAVFPDVRLIANERNVGFGQANNQGLDVMTGDVALLLNSDAFATEGAIESLLTVMEDPGIVACGGALVHPLATTQALLGQAKELRVQVETGEKHITRLVDTVLGERMQRYVQNSCCNRLTLWAVFCEQTALEKLFPSSPFFAPYWKTRQILVEATRQSPVDNRQSSYDVEQVMGACLMMRPVERFDERFFLYCEDTELCHRLRRNGRIAYVPDAVFGHELGASSTATRWESVARYNRGKELYFLIHHGCLAAFVCWKLDRLGALLRFTVAALATLLTLGAVASFRLKAGLFWRVLTAPLGGPPDPRRPA